MKQKQKKTRYSTLQNVRWILRLGWRAQKWAVILCVVSAILEILYQLAQLYAAPEILSQLQQHDSLSRLLWVIGGFTAALFSASALRQYCKENALPARIEVRMELIGMVNRKANETSYPNTLEPNFLKKKELALNSNMSNSSPTELIWSTLTELLQNIGGFALYLTILSGLNPVLIGVVLATCILGFLLSRRANRWVFEHQDEAERYYGKKSYLRSKAESPILAKDIRIFGLQNWLNEAVAHIHDAYLAYRLRMERKKLMVDAAEAVMTILRNGIAYYYLIRMALAGELGVSQFVLYFAAVSTFTQWVMGILQSASKLHEQSLAICSIREYLEYPEPFRFEDGAEITKTRAYELQLDHVSYRYPNAEKDTISAMDLTICPGEKLAIVGLNGAGKTTLVKLLCGLLDPTEGAVRLNGRDIRDFNRKEYYRLISSVFQEFSLLDVTVAETVSQSAAQQEEARIWQCLELAGIKEKIKSLPGGLSAHVGRTVYEDGILFSGGETQRLMLARALYKNGCMLILDEPTAALDPLAERDIYEKYNQMTEGKTAVFISHRLASTRFCDRILFLSEGIITEEGTHEALLTRQGEYAKLFAVQSRYYQEGREF